MLAGFTLSAAGCTPVPVSATVCTRSRRSPKAPVCAPSCVGAKLTLKVHAACAASCVPQVFETWKPLLTDAAIEVSGRSPYS